MPMPKNKRPTNKEVEDYIKKVNRIPTLSEMCRHYDLNFKTSRHYWTAPQIKAIANRIINYDRAASDEIENLENELRSLKTQVRKYEEIGALEKRILACVEELCPSIPRQAVPKAFKFDNKRTEEDALLCLSDWHFSERVSYEEMRGLNEYNIQIATIRLQAAVDSTVKILKEKLAGYDIKRLNVALLGDMASGFIHEDLRETNQVPAIESAILGADVLSQALRDLAQIFDVRVWGVSGNHARLTKRMTWKQKYNSLDWLMYRILEKNLRDVPNVRTEISKALFEIKEIRGHKYLFTHGEDIRSHGGVPWYGIERADAKLTGALIDREHYNSAFMGHFHRYGVVPRVSGGSIFINGSIKGPDEYSLGSIRSASPPVQLLCGLHKEKGVTFRFPINLEDATKRISEKQIRYNYAT